jgi:DNA polymerase-4
MSTVLFHADADAFFASVEQRDNPDLRGRPMVVGEQVVACASYEARALGIHAGMPLSQVRRRWPAVAVVPVRGGVYEEASARLFEVFRRFTPLVEPGSMEEGFLDVTDHHRGDPEGMAKALRSAIRAEVGLPVSVGVGRTKLIAKLASRRAKPDGLVVVDAALEAHLRPRLRLDDLWGVGPASVEKLTAARLFTVADLHQLSEHDLRDRGLSTAMARRLVTIAQGTDDATIRLPGPRRSVGATRSMRTTRTRSVVQAALARQVQRALERLGDDQRVPRRLEVIVRFDDDQQVTQRGPLPHPTRDHAVVTATAHALLAATGWEHDGRGVTLVGVSMALPQHRVE